MLREEQIDLRRQRAKSSRFAIRNLGRKRVFSDYRVSNAESGGEYTVSIRGFDLGDNACDCPDFKANTLGTCKHIEAVLATLAQHEPTRHKKAVVARPEQHPPPRYGPTLPPAPSLPLPNTESSEA